jgi:phosphatidylglycerophosphate synthase
VRTVQRGPAAGLVLQVGVLAGVGLVAGLPPVGWLVGLACAGVTALLLARAVAARGSGGLGPADGVTLARTALIGAVAALVAGSLIGPISVAMLVLLSAAALVLDGVDGWVARRTGTASDLGARFDMEADAFLILVLSVFVARQLGWWVLAIGLARYVFVAAGWWLPWLRNPLPYRYWRKVAAAAQGIALTVAASGLLPSPIAVGIVLAALLLLAESFGRDVAWLWRRRDAAAVTPLASRLSRAT